MTPERAGAALLSQTYGAPVWLFERSAAARAKASQSTAGAVLDAWAQKAGTGDVSLQTPASGQDKADSERSPADSPAEAATGQAPAASPTAAPAATGLTGAALLTAVAEARGMPESIIERSANARASAAGVSLEDVLHEWAEEEGLEAASSQPPAPSPKSATSSPLPTPKPKAKPVAPVAAGLSGAALLTAVAEARGMPESLVERSANARAKKTDASVEDVLNEWAQEAGLVAASDQPPAASPTTEAAAVDEAQDGSQTSDTDVQESDATREIAPRPVRSWHRAAAIGAIAALVPLVVLVLLAVFTDVPSDLSEAPWYLLALEPFLGYLEPFIVLVIIPGVVVASILTLPVVVLSPAVHPSIRRLALIVLVFLILTIVVLTTIGAVQA
jgi:hypothetical protein